MSSYTIPYVIQQTPRGERTLDLYSRLLSERIIYLGTEIDDRQNALWWRTARRHAGGMDINTTSDRIEDELVRGADPLPAERRTSCTGRPGRSLQGCRHEPPG